MEDRNPLTSQKTPEPTALEQLGPQELGIRWSDGHESRYPTSLLRRACRCALCVDEWSGRELLDPKTVPEDIHPRQIQPVGRYALRFDWSDNHSSGIYTFEYLRQICQCDSCRNKS